MTEALNYDANDFALDMGQAGAAVPRETVERIETFRARLADANARINLIGPKELDDFWRRHALDCAQLVTLAPDAKRWLDIGSGAGLPGLVIACMLAGAPGAEIHLVESTGKKARFLAETITALKLPARVFNQRIEDFDAGQGSYDVVTARAVAPLQRLIAYAKPMLDRGAQALFHKGATTDAELAAAQQALDGGGVSYRADVLPSLSSPHGRILRITQAVR